MFKKNNTLNWYQKFICFLKIGIKMLICLLTIGIKILFTFNWSLLIYFFQLVSLMTRTLILICFNWYHVERICFIVTPLLILCFEQKGEECFVFTWTPLLMIDKKGENYLSLYACFYDYACFYVDIKYWYQECLF